MKHIYFLLLCLGWSTLSFAQGPNKFRYQAVARDQSGAVITGDVSVRLSFLQDGPMGIKTYVETHQVTPNGQGVFDLTIGDGSIVSGTMNILNWSAHGYWLKVEMKPSGAGEFIDMGTTQLLSVPYARYAEKAGSELTAGAGITIVNQQIQNTGDLSESNELQVLSLNGNQLSLSNGGGSVTLPSGGGSDSWSSNGSLITNSPLSNDVAVGSTENTGAKFYVRTNSANMGGYFRNSGEGDALSTWAEGSGAGVFGTSKNGRGGQFVSVNGTAGYFNSAFGHALVTDKGNVGLGTLNPARQLHVVGSTLMTNSNGVALEIGAGSVGIGITSPTHKFEVNGSSFFENLNGPALITGNGNVGIGTPSPSSKLSVIGGNKDGIFGSSASGYGVVGASTSGFAAGYFYSTSGVGGYFASNDNYCISMHQGTAGNSINNQGILLKNSGDEWKVYIDTQHDYNFAFGNSLMAWIYDTDGSFHNYSDRSLKKNIRSFTDVLPRLKQLQAYTYQMKDAPDDSPVSVGFMAQDVEELFPQLVTEKNGNKSLCYDHFTVMSIEAIKEQEVKIEALEKKINDMEKLMEEMARMIVNTEKE